MTRVKGKKCGREDEKEGIRTSQISPCLRLRFPFLSGSAVVRRLRDVCNRSGQRQKEKDAEQRTDDVTQLLDNLPHPGVLLLKLGQHDCDARPRQFTARAVGVIECAVRRTPISILISNGAHKADVAEMGVQSTLNCAGALPDVFEFAGRRCRQGNVDWSKVEASGVAMQTRISKHVGPHDPALPAFLLLPPPSPRERALPEPSNSAWTEMQLPCCPPRRASLRGSGVQTPSDSTVDILLCLYPISRVCALDILNSIAPLSALSAALHLADLDEVWISIAGYSNFLVWTLTLSRGTYRSLSGFSHIFRIFLSRTRSPVAVATLRSWSLPQNPASIVCVPLRVVPCEICPRSGGPPSSHPNFPVRRVTSIHSHS